MPATLTATYRIVTPMFIGDADRDATEITAASVKGALRFWWRALSWGRFRNQPGATDESALRALHRAEADLFGAAADDRNPQRGQGKFLLRVIPPVRWAYMDRAWPLAGSDSGYLGQGLWESGKREKGNYQPARTALNEGQDFKLELVFRPASKEMLEDTNSIMRDVLMLWGLVGGLGSRERRGFGSVQLLSLDAEPFILQNISDWVGKVKEILSCHPVARAYPPYSAFNVHTIVGYLAPAKNARLSHAKLGLHFKNYRGQPSALRGEIKRVFGMPLAGGSHKMEKARRGSPLFFHIIQIGEQTFVPVALSLPSEPFHPDEVLNRVDWSLIDGFFGGLNSWKGDAA